MGTFSRRSSSQPPKLKNNRLARGDHYGMNFERNVRLTQIDAEETYKNEMLRLKQLVGKEFKCAKCRGTSNDYTPHVTWLAMER